MQTITSMSHQLYNICKSTTDPINQCIAIALSPYQSAPPKFPPYAYIKNVIKKYFIAISLLART
jgi:hypothetical protein